MDDFNDSVMIALLPTTSEWCRIKNPHMTLVYAGLKKDLKPTVFNELAKDASMLSMLTKTFTLRTIGIEIFGDENVVDVIRLQPSPELLSMRRAVEQWNKSQFEFEPHVTIGPTGSNVEAPSYITFNRIMVGWGKETLTFWLNNGS